MEELAQLLSEAISCGDKEEAKRCLEQLAELCVPMSVRISHKAYSQDSIRYVESFSSVLLVILNIT